MYFTTLWSKKKEDVVRKTGSQLFGVRKKWIPSIWNLKKLVHSYFDPEKLYVIFILLSAVSGIN